MAKNEACTFGVISCEDTNASLRCNISIGVKTILRIDNGDLEHMCTWLCVFSNILAIH